MTTTLKEKKVRERTKPESESDAIDRIVERLPDPPVLSPQQTENLLSNAAQLTDAVSHINGHATETRQAVAAFMVTILTSDSDSKDRAKATKRLAFLMQVVTDDIIRLARILEEVMEPSEEDDEERPSPYL